MPRTWVRKKKEEIVELIFDALTDDPQSVEKIVKKTGLNWRTVAEYVYLIKKIQSQRKIKVIENPILVWYIEE